MSEKPIDYDDFTDEDWRRARLFLANMASEEKAINENVTALYPHRRPPTELERRVAEKLGMNPDLASPYSTNPLYTMLLFDQLIGARITRVNGGYWLERGGELVSHTDSKEELYEAICNVWLGDHA